MTIEEIDDLFNRQISLEVKERIPERLNSLTAEMEELETRSSGDANGDLYRNYGVVGGNFPPPEEENDADKAPEEDEDIAEEDEGPDSDDSTTGTRRRGRERFPDARIDTSHVHCPPLPDTTAFDEVYVCDCQARWVMI